MPELITAPACGRNILRLIFPAILASEKVFSCALKVTCLGGSNAVCFCECFWGISPHLEAAVAAFPILAIEGRVAVLFERIIGHGGLLYEKGSPRVHFWITTVPGAMGSLAKHCPPVGGSDVNIS
nr:hypothetical protein [Stutzerimonas kunmingensis]